LVTYIDFIALLVISEGQADAIYFNISSAFSHVSHTMLSHKLRGFWLSDSYVN
jgi:hypothetical protein